MTLLSVIKVEEKQSLRQKTIKNIGIVSIAQVFAYVIQIASGIILARLLLPSDFGLIAISSMIISMLAMVKDIGFESAIIQKKDNINKNILCAFTVRLIFSIVLYIIAFTVSPLWAKYFSGSATSADTISSIIKVLSISIIIETFAFLPRVKLVKNLRFKDNSIADIATALSSALISVSLAFMGFSYWSLVYAGIGSNIINLLILYLMNPSEIKFIIDFTILREIYSYGKFVVITSVVMLVVSNIDNAIIGKLLGLSALGFYTLAWRWGNWTTTNIANVINKVMFPTYSQIQNDPIRLKKGLLKTLEYVLLLTFPASLGLLIIAPEFVNIVLGNKWSMAIVPLQILCIFGIINAIANTIGQIFMAKGRPDIITKSAVISLITIIITLYPAVKLFQLTGAAIAMLLYGLFSVLWQFHMLYKLLNIKLKDILNIMFPSFTSSIIMILIILGIKYSFQITNIINLIVLILISMISYLVVLYFLKTDLIYEVKNELKGFMRITN